MGSSSRRSFLQRLLGVAPAWAVAGRAVTEPAGQRGSAASPRPRPLPAPTVGSLEAIAEIVLPAGEMSATERARAVAEFGSWWTGFTPEAELDHPYLWSDELQYGPEDPRPGWIAQLEALEAEARRIHGATLGELELDQRRALITTAMREATPGGESDGLPPPEEAAHVAWAMLAWYFSSPAANDLCYRAEIGRHECRGLPTVGREPGALEPDSAGVGRSPLGRRGTG